MIIFIGGYAYEQKLHAGMPNLMTRKAKAAAKKFEERVTRIAQDARKGRSLGRKRGK